MTEQQAVDCTNTIVSLLAHGKPAPGLIDEIAAATGMGRRAITAVIIDRVKPPEPATRLTI